MYILFIVIQLLRLAKPLPKESRRGKSAHIRHLSRSKRLLLLFKQKWKNTGSEKYSRYESKN